MPSFRRSLSHAMKQHKTINAKYGYQACRKPVLSMSKNDNNCTRKGEGGTE